MANAEKLTPREQRIYELIQSNDVNEITELLSHKDAKVDCLDKNGMTPLQHAAFKGNRELCELLLNHGADVNNNNHDQGYTALMFAALSGNEETVQLLLTSGAKTSPTNTVNRTAAQMAGFVGQHKIVSLINNFLPREKLEYYNQPHGLETEPKLKPELTIPLHGFLLVNNLHPVNLTQYLQAHPCLVDNLPAIAKLLSLMSEQQVKEAEINEVMSIKMHYIASLCKRLQQWLKDESDNLAVPKVQKLTAFIKCLLNGRDVDGFPLVMEKFCRQTIREYPYHDSVLLQQLVRNIAPVEIGCYPTALSVLIQAVNGQRGADDDQDCTTCGKSNAKKKCSACKMVNYCSQECQKLHWFTHKKVCKKLFEEYQREEKKKARLKKEEEELKRQAEIVETETAGDVNNEEDITANNQKEDAGMTGKEMLESSDEKNNVVETRDDGSELISCPFTGMKFWMKDGKVVESVKPQEAHQENVGESEPVSCPFSGEVSEGPAEDACEKEAKDTEADPGQIAVEL